MRQRALSDSHQRVVICLHEPADATSGQHLRLSSPAVPQSDRIVICQVVTARAAALGWIAGLRDVQRRPFDHGRHGVTDPIGLAGDGEDFFCAMASSCDVVSGVRTRLVVLIARLDS